MNVCVYARRVLVRACIHTYVFIHAYTHTHSYEVPIKASPVDDDGPSLLAGFVTRVKRRLVQAYLACLIPFSIMFQRMYVCYQHMSW